MFCRICTLDDLFACLGVQCEEPFEEIAVEEPGGETFLPSYNRSVPVVHGNRIGESPSASSLPHETSGTSQRLDSRIQRCST